MRQITFLGTGHGMPKHSSCSSLLLEDGDTNILLDAGGGHDLLRRSAEAKKDLMDVENVFITHYDSDHILGIIPIVRTWKIGDRTRRRRIFCLPIVKEAIVSLFTHVAGDRFEQVQESLEFVLVEHGFEYSVRDWTITFFDINSTKSPQCGCVIRFADSTRLAFLGDEPLREHYLDIVRGAEIVIHDAFCLDADEPVFRAHAKHHSTVKEAAVNATTIGAQTLLLYHMEDTTLDIRKEAYAAEAQRYFEGTVFVPVDGDVFTIS